MCMKASVPLQVGGAGCRCRRRDESAALDRLKAQFQEQDVRARPPSVRFLQSSSGTYRESACLTSRCASGRIYVSVERELAHFPHRHLTVWPDLGDVKDVPAERLCIFGIEDLHIEGPRRVFAACDGLEQILCMPVGVDGGKVSGLFKVQGPVALVLKSSASYSEGCRSHVR